MSPRVVQYLHTTCAHIFHLNLSFHDSPSDDNITNDIIILSIFVFLSRIPTF